MIFFCVCRVGKQSKKAVGFQDLVPLQVHTFAFEPQHGPHIPMKNDVAQKMTTMSLQELRRSIGKNRLLA